MNYEKIRSLATSQPVNGKRGEVSIWMVGLMVPSNEINDGLNYFHKQIHCDDYNLNRKVRLQEIFKSTDYQIDINYNHIDKKNPQSVIETWGKPCRDLIITVIDNVDCWVIYDGWTKQALFTIDWTFNTVLKVTGPKIKWDRKLILRSVMKHAHHYALSLDGDRAEKMSAALKWSWKKHKGMEV